MAWTHRGLIEAVPVVDTKAIHLPFRCSLERGVSVNFLPTEVPRRKPDGMLLLQHPSGVRSFCLAVPMTVVARVSPCEGYADYLIKRFRSQAHSFLSHDPDRDSRAS